MKREATLTGEACRFHDNLGPNFLPKQSDIQGNTHSQLQVVTKTTKHVPHLNSRKRGTFSSKFLNRIEPTAPTTNIMVEFGGSLRMRIGNSLQELLEALQANESKTLSSFLC